MEQLPGLDGVVQVTDQRRVGGLVEVLDAELVLDELDADLGHADGALAQVDLVVGVLLHQRGDAGELGVPVGRAVAGPEMISGVRASSIRDRVDLVDDGEVVAALHHVVGRVRHVVAQVVETELALLVP